MDYNAIKNIKRINFKLIVETGLHIGGNSDSYGIGGVDSPVIKNPLNNQPIIPGSSLKGKIRMLLSNVRIDNKDLTSTLNIMFGSNDKDYKGLPRIIFRDITLTEDSVVNLQNRLGEGFFTEIKAENSINKKTGVAMPRFIERVPAGAVFQGEVIVNKHDVDEINYEEYLYKGFQLLEKNYLGGSGSRGYGKVKIEIINE